MKKRIYVSILIGIITIVLSFLIGVYIYKLNNIEKNSTEIGEVDEEILVDDECTRYEELKSINTNSTENKVSPMAKLTLRILYKQCNHVIEKSEKVDGSEIVNLTKEEFQEKYPDWQIQRFTPTEIILYKEVDDFCNEHYKIKENDGNIAVYKINKDGNESLERITDIPISYLTNEDIEKIKNGIIVYSKKELNKTIEDFE